MICKLIADEPQSNSMCLVEQYCSFEERNGGIQGLAVRGIKQHAICSTCHRPKLAYVVEHCKLDYAVLIA